METPMGNFIVALSTSRVVLNVSHFCHSCMHEGLLRYYVSTKSLYIPKSFWAGSAKLDKNEAKSQIQFHNN